jgi:23S rRNA (guanine745-N1)-methyltransferase
MKDSSSRQSVWPLICPICEAGLVKVDNVLKCPASHSFDISREGYVNLLLPGRRRKKVLGDTKDMLRARRRFLDRGFYVPLSDGINQHICDHLMGASSLGGSSSPTCIADVGCGEGHYIGRLSRYLDERGAGTGVRYFGLDISKEAVRLAAKRYDGIWFFVGSTKHRILLAEESVQVILNVFAPRNSVEFARVSVRGGLLLVVIPHPDHLANLRSALDLLDIEADKRERVVEQMSEPFELVGEQTIGYDIVLDEDDVSDLIQMTPNYWHMSEVTRQAARAMGETRTWAGFIILSFRRISSLDKV